MQATSSPTKDHSLKAVSRIGQAASRLNYAVGRIANPSPVSTCPHYRPCLLIVILQKGCFDLDPAAALQLVLHDLIAVAARPPHTREFILTSSGPHALFISLLNSYKPAKHPSSTASCICVRFYIQVSRRLLVELLPISGKPALLDCLNFRGGQVGRSNVQPDNIANLIPSTLFGI